MILYIFSYFNVYTEIIFIFFKTLIFSFFFTCRSGLGSLNRGFARTSTPELVTGAAGGNFQRKTKAVMLWRKGWKGWKKIQSFGAISKGEFIKIIFIIYVYALK